MSHSRWQGFQVSNPILGRNQKGCDTYSAALRPAYHAPMLASLQDSAVSIDTFGALLMGRREGKPTVVSRSRVPANRRWKGRG
jgi:hypothetical protein